MAKIPPTLATIPSEVLELCREAIAELLQEGKRITVASVRRLARRDQLVVGPVVKAYKAKLTPPLTESWAHESGGQSRAAAERGGSGKDESEGREALALLVERIRSAESDDDRRLIQQEACALALEGNMEKWQAVIVEKLLAAARQDAKQHRASSPDVDVEQFVLCGTESYQFVRVYEGIVSEERRVAVLGFLAEQAELDAVENPVVDTSPGAVPARDEEAEAEE